MANEDYNKVELTEEEVAGLNDVILNDETTESQKSEESEAVQTAVADDKSAVADDKSAVADDKSAEETTTEESSDKEANETEVEDSFDGLGFEVFVIMDYQEVRGSVPSHLVASVST